MIDYSISKLWDYPDNGKHQETKMDLPFFEIRKGEDEYHYSQDGKEYKYNSCKNVTKMWIINLIDNPPDFLSDNFKIKTSKDHEKLIDYALQQIEYSDCEIAKQESLKNYISP